MILYSNTDVLEAYSTRPWDRSLPSGRPPHLGSSGPTAWNCPLAMASFEVASFEVARFEVARLEVTILEVVRLEVARLVGARLVVARLVVATSSCQPD